MGDALIIVYFVVGILLTFYWWDKHYEKIYNEAKESEEGVDESMSVIFLTILTVFWPIVLIRKLIKRIRKINRAR
jgi:hypothetical protein